MELVLPFLELRDLLSLSLTCKFLHKTLDDLLSPVWQSGSLTVSLGKIAFGYLTNNKRRTLEQYLGVYEKSYYLPDVVTLVGILTLLLNGTRSLWYANFGQCFGCYNEKSSKEVVRWGVLIFDNVTQELIQEMSQPLRAITAKIPGSTVFSMCHLLRNPEQLKEFRQHWT